MSVPIIHFIEVTANTNLSAIQGKITRVFNASAGDIDVVYGSNTYTLETLKSGDFMWTGTAWIDPTTSGSAVISTTNFDEADNVKVPTCKAIYDFYLPQTADINIYVCRSSESGYTAGDYATINAALEYARTIQMQCGKYIYVNVRDNHVIDYQVIIENCDLSYVVIQRVGASMTAFNVNPSGFVVYPGTSIYALFYVKNSRSPLFNMLFNLQKVTYSAQAYRGLHADFSHINGSSGAGFQNCAGAGVIGVSESVISWTGLRSTGNTLQGIAVFGCRAYISSATLTGNVQNAIAAEQSSMVYANGITATTTTAGTSTCRAAEGSFLNISDAVLAGTTSTTPIQCVTGSIIHARNTTAATNITVNSTPSASGIIMR